MGRLKIAAVIGGVLAVGAAAGAWRSRWRWLSQQLKFPEPRYAVRVERGLRVPMSDSVALLADHYYPTTPGNYPTLLRRTPYARRVGSGPGGAYSSLIAHLLAAQGYHVVVQDVRGRFDSGGEFSPFVHEAADGRATLDWIAGQSWFDGNLGTFGESYNGWTQWTLTGDPPPYLKAIVPTITGAYGYAYSYAGEGVFALSGMLGWVAGLESGHKGWSFGAMRRQVQPALLDRELAAGFEQMSVGGSDEAVLGHPILYYRNLIVHSRSDDPFWQAIDYRAGLPEMTIPAHIVGGWYDIFLHDTLADYAALRSGGQRPYLTIGPWTHGLDAVMSGLREGLKWYAAHLKGETGQLRRDPVSIYVMGADEWRGFDEWPPPATATHHYLASDHALAEQSPTASLPDHYTYDPADPTPMWGGPLFHHTAGARDNRPLEARNDVLTFTGPPLAASIEVIGPVKADLYVASDREHTDFFVRLCDVQPDGTSLNICDGLLRVRPGVGEVQPDGSLRITVDMWATAHRFKAGHRLRVLVASGAHPRYSRNPGTGEPTLTATTLLPAHQTIYHDAAHPSAVVLPLV